MSNLCIVDGDWRAARVAKTESAVATAVATAVPDFPPPVLTRAERVVLDPYWESCPQPDWAAADAAMSAPPRAPDPWDDLPPVPDVRRDWRRNAEYCAALSAWMVENLFDRVDTLALWNARAYDGKGGWFRPVDAAYDAGSAAEALQLAFREAGGKKHRIIGSYVGDPASRTCKALVADIDGHKDGDTPDADLRSLEALCESEGLPYFLASSKGNGGAHLRILFAEPVPYAVAHNLGNLLRSAAALPAKTEMNPKSPAQQTYGNQVALFGSEHFFLKSGGSMVIRNRTHENVPFQDWLTYLAGVRRATLEDVLAFGRRRGVDLSVDPAAIPRVRAPGATTTARPATARATDADFGVAPRGEDVSTLAALSDFLTSRGYAPVVVRPDGAAKYKVELPRCVLEEFHSSKTGNPVIFYDADLGAITGHTCLHASCNAAGKITASKFLRHLGCEVEVVHRAGPAPALAPAPAAAAWRGPALEVPHAPIWDLVYESPAPRSTCTCDLLLTPPEAQAAAPSADPWADMPPPPLPPRDEGVGDITARALAELEPTVAVSDPRALRRRLGAPERALLNQVAVEQHGHGTPERTRALRIADCGRGQQVRWCETHQVVHSCPLMCGRAGACVACAGAVATDRREYVATHWPEAGWVRVDVGRSVALSDPATAYGAARRALARLKAIVRKRRIRGRRWFIGAHTVLLATLRPIDAVYVSDALKYAGVAHELLGTLSPMESADLVYDVTVEPARVLEDLLGSAVGAACVSDFPYLTESHVRRTDGGRVGAQLPWASEDELRAEKKERAREAAVARGEDPDAFDHATCPRAVALSDGSVARCGRPLQARVVVDGVEVARGRTGAPAWAANDRAFAVMAAERVHRRETSHLPAS